MATTLLPEQGEIQIEDLGVTLRTLFAKGATGYATSKRRKWKLRYKGVIVGSITVSDQPRKVTPNVNS